MATAAKVNIATMKTTLTAARENLAAIVSLGIKWREDKAELARCNENPFWEGENTLKTHFPWRFSSKLKEKCQESKLYLDFLHLWSIFLHFWV